jgi:hypothetical protein
MSEEFPILMKILGQIWTSYISSLKAQLITFDAVGHKN